MSRFKFINILDAVFISVSVFLLVFAWLNFYISNLFLSILASAIVSSCLLFFINFLKNKSRAKTNEKQSNQLKAEQYATNFQLYSEAQKLKTISKFIDDNYEFKIHTHYLTIPENKTYIFIANHVEKVSKSILLNFIKSYIKKANQIIIFTNEYDQDALNFSKSISNIKIKLLNKLDFYSLCTLYNVGIKEIIETKQTKRPISQFFKSFFSKKHSKGFFISGLLILFTSLIIPFKNYYIIWGSILIIFSIICRLPKFKEIDKHWLEF